MALRLQLSSRVGILSLKANAVDVIPSAVCPTMHLSRQWKSYHAIKTRLLSIYLSAHIPINVSCVSELSNGVIKMVPQQKNTV